MIIVAYAVSLVRRRAPHLFRYKPSYTSFLTKKSRKKVGENPTRASRRGRRGRGTREAGVVILSEATGSNSPPLGRLWEPIDQSTLEPSPESGEMVRKEREPVNLRLAIGGARGGHTASPGSSRPTVPSDDSQPRKKQRTDVPEGGEGNETNLGKNVIDLEDQREGVRAEGPQSDEWLTKEELRAPWTPAFETFLGHQINYGDYASLSSSVAYGILQAGSLPRDVNKALKEPTSLIREIAQYLVLVSASPYCSLLFYR